MQSAVERTFPPLSIGSPTDTVPPALLRTLNRIRPLLADPTIYTQGKLLTKTHAFTALALAALAGCGGPPGDEDLRAAMRAQMEGVGGKQAASAFENDVKQAKIIGCVKADAGGYKCDFKGIMGIAQSARLVKSDGGWTIVMGN